MVRPQGSNELGFVMCDGDGTTKNKKKGVHEECLE